MIFSREFVSPDVDWPLWGYLTYRDFQLGEVERLWCEALMFMYVRLWQQCGCIYLHVVAGTASGPDTQTEGCFPHGTCSGCQTSLCSSPLLTIHLKKLNHATGRVPVRLDNSFASKYNQPGLNVTSVIYLGLRLFQELFCETSITKFQVSKFQ